MLTVEKRHHPFRVRRWRVMPFVSKPAPLDMPWALKRDGLTIGLYMTEKEAVEMRDDLEDILTN